MKSALLTDALSNTAPCRSAAEKLVPELIQKDATGENLATEAGRWLGDRKLRDRLHERFVLLHDNLKCDASSKAADAVCKLLEDQPLG